MIISQSEEPFILACWIPSKTPRCTNRNSSSDLLPFHNPNHNREANELRHATQFGCLFQPQVQVTQNMPFKIDLLTSTDRSETFSFSLNKTLGDGSGGALLGGRRTQWQWVPRHQPGHLPALRGKETANPGVKRHPHRPWGARGISISNESRIALAQLQKHLGVVWESPRTHYKSWSNKGN